MTVNGVRRQIRERTSVSPWGRQAKVNIAEGQVEASTPQQDETECEGLPTKQRLHRSRRTDPEGSIPLLFFSCFAGTD